MFYCLVALQHWCKGIGIIDSFCVDYNSILSVHGIDVPLFGPRKSTQTGLDVLN